MGNKTRDLLFLKTMAHKVLSTLLWGARTLNVPLPPILEMRSNPNALKKYVRTVFTDGENAFTRLVRPRHLYARSIPVWCILVCLFFAFILFKWWQTCDTLAVQVVL